MSVIQYISSDADFKDSFILIQWHLASWHLTNNNLSNCISNIWYENNDNISIGLITEN